MKKAIKLISFCLITVALLDNCSSPKENKVTSTTDNSEKNKKTALIVQELFNKHDPNAMLKYMTPDFTDYGDGLSPPVKGLQEAIGFLQTYFTAFPDVKLENLKAFADGNQVAVFCDLSGTFKGELMGMKPTGKSFKVKDVDLFKFDDEGKITEHSSVQSFGTILQQVGAEMK